MKNDRGREKGDGQGRNKGKFCSNQSFGQGRRRTCSYGKNGSADDIRPQQSLITTLFDGLDRIIDRSRKTIGLLSGRTGDYPGSGRKLEHLPPGADTPDLTAGSEPQENKQLIDKK